MITPVVNIREQKNAQIKIDLVKRKFVVVLSTKIYRKMTEALVISGIVVLIFSTLLVVYCCCGA
jgi:hypothetical protein